MARCQKVFGLAAGQGYRVALRPGSASITADLNWNQCTYVKAHLTPGAGATAEVFVKFVTVAPGDAAPAAPVASPAPGGGAFDDYTRLLAGTAIAPGGVHAVTEYGAKFGKGYSPEVTGSPVATHALIWSVQDGFLNLTAE